MITTLLQGRAWRGVASVLLASMLVFSTTGCLTAMTGVAPSTLPITEDDTYVELGSTWGTAYGVQFVLIPIFPESLSAKSKQVLASRVVVSRAMWLGSDSVACHPMTTGAMPVRCTGSAG